MEENVVKNELQVLEERLSDNPLFGDPFQYFSDILSEVLPDPAVINKLLYKLLLEEVAVSSESVSTFLQNVLTTIQFNNSCEFNYKAVIFSPSDSFQSLWSILVHLIKSSFSYHGVPFQFSSSPLIHIIQYPTCDLLLHFYIEYILKNLSLIKDLFGWTLYCERRTELMQWINAMYKFHTDHIDVSGNLHKLLYYAIDRGGLDSQLSSLANSTQSFLKKCIQDILNVCEACFTDGTKLTKFLNHCTFEYISIRICVHLLCSLTRKEQFLTQEIPLTLKELVRHFFRVSSTEKKEKGHTFLIRKRNFCAENFKGKINKTSVKCLPQGDKNLHILCRKNEFGNLLQFLSKNKHQKVNLNVRNKAKQTPLHVACILSNHVCVKILLDSGIDKNPLDVYAVDAFSCTPLHYAVMANDVEVVKLLMQYGGLISPIMEKDISQRSPYDYARSSKMVFTLESYLKPNELFSSQHFEVSVIEKQNYSIYLTALRLLLCDYFQMFELFKFQLDFEVVEHNQSSCAHFSKHASGKLCVEDYSVLFFLPQLISNMIEYVKTEAAENSVNVNKELLLLDMFSKSC